jgi:hypothetical protein
MNVSVISGITCLLLGSYLIYATTKSIKEGKDDGPSLSYQGIAFGVMFIAVGIALIAGQI